MIRGKGVGLEQPCFSPHLLTYLQPRLEKIHSYLVFPSNQTSNVFEAANKAKIESHKMAQSGYFIGQSLGLFVMFIPITNLLL